MAYLRTHTTYIRTVYIAAYGFKRTKSLQLFPHRHGAYVSRMPQLMTRLQKLLDLRQQYSVSIRKNTYFHYLVYKKKVALRQLFKSLFYFLYLHFRTTVQLTSLIGIVCGNRFVISITFIGHTFGGYTLFNQPIVHGFCSV